MFKQLCCKIGFDTAENKPPQRGKLCWILLADAAEQRTSLRGLSAAAPVSAGRTPCGVPRGRAAPPDAGLFGLDLDDLGSEKLYFLLLPAASLQLRREEVIFIEIT